MKGKSLRRRQKNVVAARSANLYKAQFGRAAKWEALPEPPRPDDYKQPIPKSARRIMDYIKQQEVGGGEQSTSPPGATPALRKVKNKFKPRDGQSPANPDSNGPSTSARNEADTAVAKSTSRSTKKGIQEAASVPSTLKQIFAASLSVPIGKKTKAKRKLVLDEKKKLKKLKRQVATLSAMSSRLQKSEDNEKFKSMPQDEIEFGEVTHAPPKVTLKRRHWDEAQVQEAHKKRHQAVLLKQMKAAEEQLRRGGQGAGGGEVSAAEQQQARHKEQIRHQVLDAYRQRKGARQKGANLHSLKALVYSQTV